MRLKDKVTDIPLERPDGVSEEQWKKAIDLYKTAKSMGDRYPELTVAQAALETGWFKHPSGKYNYFGQKASASQEGSYVTTHEFSGDSKYKIRDKFRDYDSLGAAIKDRLNKWGSKYKDADSVREALYSIWSYDADRGMGVGYATDIKYDNKIFTILGMMGKDVKTIQEQHAKDTSIYGMNEKGEIVNINPKYATDVEKKSSDIYKNLFYKQTYPNTLTNFNRTQENTTFATDKGTTIINNKTVVKEEKEEEVPQWKLKLQQKIKERKKLVGFIKEGGIDYVAPERKPSNTVQMIQQSYMENGGQIPVSSNGLYDYPNETVLVPVTDGRVTMKNISYPVLGIADTGEQILMQPNKEYKFKGAKTVLEIPQPQ